MHNLWVNRKHSSSEILLITLAICWNSNYQDNNEIKENIARFNYALRVLLYPKCPILAIQIPKRQYNLNHCTLPLLHGVMDEYSVDPDQLIGINRFSI